VTVSPVSQRVSVEGLRATLGSLSAPEIKARETAWSAESERRIDAFEVGKLGARDAKEVLADLRSSFGK
jgi:hypothetical protein